MKTCCAGHKDTPARSSFAARGLLAVLRFYHKYISRLTGRSCRFYPTCSAYMARAVLRYGALRGLGMGLWRLLRCHPFSKGGYDPVPEDKP